MSIDWEAITWHRAELDLALVEMARRLGLSPRPAASANATPERDETGAELDHWLEASAAGVGLHIQHAECGYPDVRHLLRRLGPSLLRLEVAGQRRYLVVSAATRRHLAVLTPRLAVTRLPHEAVVERLTAALETEASAPVVRWLSTVGVPRRRLPRARHQLLALMLEQRRVEGVFLLGPDPGAPFLGQLSQRGLSGRAALTLALSVAHVAVTLQGWVLLGRAALDGHTEAGWISAWALTHLTAFPLQLAVLWVGGGLLQEISMLLKQRLLCGALRMDPEQLRRRGAGRLLAMVFESEALESAGLAGAFGLALSFVQLASASVVIGLGSSAALELVILLLWCGFVAHLVRRYLRQRGVWTRERFDLGRAFVENVVGNRTRIAQQPRERWHLLEDRQLDAHLATSARMDEGQTRLMVLPARGWLLASSAGLIPVLLASGANRADVAIAVGGMLQAYGALGALAAGAVTIGSAAVAWTEVGQLFDAAARFGKPGDRAVALPARPRSDSGSARAPAHALDARGVSFSYQNQQKPILQGCHLSLVDGDRVLLEGPSGAGKSTLASLIVGLREPDAGNILLSGLDRATLGDAAWRRRVTSAPQFHENHILSASLAFNLLMGRAWPASAGDLARAEEVCRALELGTLIDRMPSGLQQIIGETGWQLSHGERSRLFLARALLQGSDLLVLDESFGALDADTLQRCMATVLARARTLLVIAHP